jgi:phospholipase C
MNRSFALASTAILTTALLSPALGQNTSTATPIQHLVIIFPENISFDHYFGTYPHAENPPNEPKFVAAPNTPAVNGLSSVLLTKNPNAVNPENGQGAVNPFRLDRSQAATADQQHAYTPEQMAFHAGLMDLFPKSVGRGDPLQKGAPSPLNTTGLTMGYFDGNTVTALWNYAQRFTLNDNSYGTNFGPSTPGAINLVSGQTNGVIETRNGKGGLANGGAGSLTLISDPDPIGDVCSPPTRMQGAMGGRNIGNLLTDAGVTWGWFMGGFDLALRNANGTTGCRRSIVSPVTHKLVLDYLGHHEPFQYYASTANPTHARPKSIQLIGQNGDGANHQYDIDDFFVALKAGNFPAVSFLKPPGFQDGHAGYSDPLDEQHFLVKVINFLQTRPEWKSTAVIVAYDDSDGWYDHQMGPIVNQSTGSTDALTGEGSCGDGKSALPGIDPNNTHAQGRCGFGPRLPMLAISPWAKVNFVDSALTNQASIITFIEDNWLHGKRIGQGSFDSISNSVTSMFDFVHQPRMGKLFLDEETGEPTHAE